MDEYFTILGKIASVHATLETQMGYLAGDLMRVRLDWMEIVTSNIDFVRLIRILRALARERMTDGGRQFLDDVMARCERLNPKRSELIHSGIYSAEDDVLLRTRHAVTGSGRVDKVMEPLDVDGARALLHEFAETLEDLDQIRQRLRRNVRADDESIYLDKPYP